MNCTCCPNDECPVHGLERTINVRTADPARAGGCNFCTRPRRGVVYVVTSSDHVGGGLEVRFCPTCWKELKT